MARCNLKVLHRGRQRHGETKAAGGSTPAARNPLNRRYGIRVDPRSTPKLAPNAEGALMLFNNRRTSVSSHLRGPDQPEARAHGTRRLIGSMFAGARRSLSHLVMWMLLILAGVGLTMGYLGLHGFIESARELNDDGRHPMWSDIVQYSSRFRIAVQVAHRDRRDILASHAAFCAIWSEVSPNEPMIVKFVSPATIDRRSGKPVWAGYGEPNPVDPKTFRMLHPVLVEIRTLILEGDGSGRGKLAISGYLAEPAERELAKSPKLLTTEEPGKKGTGPFSGRDQGACAPLRSTRRRLRRRSCVQSIECNRAIATERRGPDASEVFRSPDNLPPVFPEAGNRCCRIGAGILETPGDRPGHQGLRCVSNFGAPVSGPALHELSWWDQAEGKPRPRRVPG